MSINASDLELRHLRSFAELARTLHFGRAADSLFVSQSTLSHQIRQLETAVGTRLLDRTTRRVDLTRAGERLARGVWALIPEIQDLLEEVHAIGDGKLGRLRVASVGSLTYGVLPGALRLHHLAQPDVEVRVRGEMLTPDQVVALRRDEIDVGLLRPPIGEAHDLIVEVLGNEPLVCAVPAGHRFEFRESVTPDEILDEPLILYRQGSAVRSVSTQLLGVAATDIVAAYEVSETHTVVSLVAGNLGVSIVPASLAEIRLHGVAYVPIVTDARIEVAIATRSETDRTLTTGFADAVREVLTATERFQT